MELLTSYHLTGFNFALQEMNQLPADQVPGHSLLGTVPFPWGSKLWICELWGQPRAGVPGWAVIDAAVGSGSWSSCGTLSSFSHSSLQVRALGADVLEHSSSGLIS